MSAKPVCNCFGCRFEKPRLEARIAELERALADWAGATIDGWFDEVAEAARNASPDATHFEVWRDA